MKHLYVRAVLAKHPVGYWRLGESSGPAAHDRSGNQRGGIYHGNVSFGETGALSSDTDTAAAFDEQAYVEIPDDASFSQPASGKGLSIEAWFRPDALDFDGETADRPYIYWMGKGETGAREWAFRFYNSESADRPNRISAYVFNPDGKLGAGAYTEEPLVEGEWIHIVACFDAGDFRTAGAGVRLYKNGVASRPTPGALYNNPKWQISPAHGGSPLRLGTRDGKSFFSGALDEVAIYPRVLSADEVLENYTLGSQ